MIANNLRSSIACVLFFVATAPAIFSQTYEVGPGNSANPSKSKEDQPLGWGSNIQNARLARAAEEALRHGDHALAFSYAQRAAQAAPNDPQLWFLLGYAARLNGSMQQSVEAYNRGLRLSPSSLEGLSGLAQANAQMGRIEEAVRLLKQVVAADPKRKEDELLLGDLYMKSGDYASALDSLEKAERSGPSARAELLMALSYQHLQQMDLADRYLELAKRHAPDNPEVQRSMAGYYREMGHYSEAIAALKSIRNPKPDVEAELAYTYRLDDKPEDSARLYAHAATAQPKDLELQLSAAQSEIAIGSLEKANTFLKRASGLNASYYRLHAINCEIAQLRDRAQDAVHECIEAVAQLPPNPVEGPLYGIQLHMNLVALYKVLKDGNDADRQLHLAQNEINSVNGPELGGEQFLRLRAMIKMNAGDMSGALADVKQAITKRPQDRSNLQLDGDILMKLGRIEDAIAAYNQILVTNPANRFALTSLGYASRAAGRDLEAERYFQRLAQADPTSYIPQLALGDLYTARREFPKAQAAYNKGYSLSAGNAMIVAGGMNAAIEAHDLTLAGVWMSRATADMESEPHVLREKERYLSFEGRYRESADVGRKAIESLPGDRDVVVYLGYDLLHLEKYDELLALTSQYLSILPREPDVPLLEGYVHKHQGQFEEAEQDFTEALERDPTVVTARVNRGYMLNDLHQPKAAADDFELALKAEPNNGEAHLGLAYASLDLSKPQIALRHATLAESFLGDSKDIHVIRATAYGLQDMLLKAANEYREALKFAPGDGSLHLGLGSIFLALRRYHDAIHELEIAQTVSADNANVYAMLARCHAGLHERDEALHYIELAELHAQSSPRGASRSLMSPSQIFVSTGETLGMLGDREAAMARFRKALTMPGSDRTGVRLAIAQIMAQQSHAEDAQRQIALALMEAEAGETAPPTGGQLIAAADVFRTMHEYPLSQSYLQRAKAAGAPDEKVRIGLANNYLALGDTTKARAELSAVSAETESAPDYQFLLAQANVFRQEHNNVQALTSFAQASNAEGEDQTAQEALLQAGANEGLRLTPIVSLLSDFSIEPIFEDTTVYVLDSKLDASFAVPSSDTALLPPPRSSLETQWTNAFHLHLNGIPTSSGFVQVRNATGQISVPSTNSIVNRNTTDYTFNFGMNPTVTLGSNVFTFNSGVQETIRRDSDSPVAMNQNLFRVFTYLSTNSLFKTVSVNGYLIRDAGPFVESNLHSRALAGALDFRVAAPWGKMAFLTGWGANDQKFSPINYEDYYTSSYLGAERRFRDLLELKAVVEDLRAWRVVGTNSGIAQELRPAGNVDFKPKRNWDLHLSTAYSSNRSFHVYDAVQNSVSLSYARPFRRKFNDESEEVVLQYPIRFSAGIQQESFFNFNGDHRQELRPYFRISLF